MNFHLFQGSLNLVLFNMWHVAHSNGDVGLTSMRLTMK